MARIINKFIKGTVGPYTFKEYRGQQLLVSKPGKGGIRQTQNTIEWSGTFGKASSFAAAIRDRFKIQLGANSDGSMVNRLNAAVINVFDACRDPKTKSFTFEGDSFQSLTGFDFNMKSPIAHSLRVVPRLSISEGNLKVFIPELSIPSQFKFPRNCFYCRMTISVIMFRLHESEKTSRAFSQIAEVEKAKGNVEAQEFIFKVANDSLCIAAVFLHYYNKQNGFSILWNHKQFSPSAICGAFITDANAKSKGEFNWLQMPRFTL